MTVKCIVFAIYKKTKICFLPERKKRQLSPDKVRHSCKYHYICSYNKKCLFCWYFRPRSLQLNYLFSAIVASSIQGWANFGTADRKLKASSFFLVPPPFGPRRWGIPGKRAGSGESTAACKVICNWETLPAFSTSWASPWLHVHPWMEAKRESWGAWDKFIFPQSLSLSKVKALQAELDNREGNNPPLQPLFPFLIFACKSFLQKLSANTPSAIHKEAQQLCVGLLLKMASLFHTK